MDNRQQSRVSSYVLSTTSTTPTPGRFVAAAAG